MSNARFTKDPSGHVLKSAGRDEAIDIIRGYCIISMVTGHIAGATILSSAFHVFPKFDGASGFVLLSGLILGKVQYARVKRLGMRSVQLKTFKRLIMVYGLQISLGALGCMAVLAGWRNGNYPPLESLSNIELLTNTLMMTFAPPGGDVLRLYVFLLGVAMIGYVLLARDQWLIFLTLSVSLNTVAQIFPTFTSFSPFTEQAASAGWAGWQLLFSTALIIGWYWHRLNISSWLDAHALKVFCACVLVIVAIGGISLLISPAIEELLFSKRTFPLGRIIAAYSVVIALYIGTRGILRKFPQLWIRPVWMIGKRSLDAYIIQAVATILIFGFTPISSSSSSAMIVAALTLLACWCWAEGRSYYNRGRSTFKVGMQHPPVE